MKKLKSLTIFFPFYNDAGTVERAISDAYKYGNTVADQLEVVAIHGGRSDDNTMAKILQQKQKHKGLIVIDKTDNYESYAVIKYGFQKASKEWVFYTDGDLQYDLSELRELVKKQDKTTADVVNGYKKSRGDGVARILFGEFYKHWSKLIFNLPIKDLTCDFRLIKNSYLKKINLVARDASLLLELIKKLQYEGAEFAEVPVNHRPRTYGKSTYSMLKLVKERLLGDIKTWLKLIYNKSL